MKTLQIRSSLLLLFLTALFLTSCSEEAIESDDYTSVSVKLSSYSTLYSAVYLDVKDVQIQTGADSTNPDAWISLGAINAGVYNFTDMKEDAELVLVEDLVIPAAHIYKVKLVLGDDNAMVMNQVLYAIDTPTAAHKESVNEVNRGLKANKSYEFTLKFELDRSLQVNGRDVTLVPKMNTEMRLYELF
jgi:hypothetical protein